MSAKRKPRRSADKAEHRAAAVGKGLPGLHNGQRSVRFADRRKVAAKRACRGRVSLEG